VQGCAHCQAALAALLAERFAVPPPSAVACAAWADDLPAFLDLERSAGALVAAQAFPGVWWQLWTCPECAEAYYATAALLDATDAGLLMLPPQAADLRPVTLTRTFLNAVFGPQQAAGAAWSGAAEPVLLAEDDLPFGRLAISVRVFDAEHWYMDVHVSPTTTGAVTVRCGAQIYYASLSDGYAQLGPLPYALLVDRAGPDLDILVEPEPEPDEPTTNGAGNARMPDEPQ
jgi:hypothetical protein